MCKCRLKLYHYIDNKTKKLIEQVNLGMGTDGELYSPDDIKHTLRGQLNAYTEVRFFVEREMGKYNVEDS